MTDVDYRIATAADADAIAGLHADSWRRAYRGMYTDEFLDGDLVAERLGVWRPRLADPPPNQYVRLAEADGELAGFICGYADNDPTWGSLIDNLHVSIDYRRTGIASELMGRAADWFTANADSPSVYLWVIEQNTGARRFYETLGATNAETVSLTLQSGNPGTTCRYVWPTTSALSRGRPG
jgi:ribosomal protein S18 acetylase RimI-like enzyme